MVHLTDRFGRFINYLRVSLTERCNLRCLYCMPQEGAAYNEPKEILKLDEILRIVRIACSLGVNKLRFTGGEPLLRRNLFYLIESILEISQIEDFSLTTNGVLLKDYAHKLKSIGVQRLNVSLDTLDEKKFKYITRSDCFNRVLEGIEASLAAGLLIKLNMVVMRGINDDEVFNFIRFCQEKKITVRFIEFMPLNQSRILPAAEYVPSRELRDILEKNFGKIMPCDNYGSGPAVYYRIAGFSHPIGFISPMSEKFCATCNRLRLSNSGALLPCLGSNFKIDLMPLLRTGVGDEEIVRLIMRAVNCKPKEHYLGGTDCFSYVAMSEVGG